MRCGKRKGSTNERHHNQMQHFKIPIVNATWSAVKNVAVQTLQAL